MSPGSSQAKAIETLHSYLACDISDILLKLEKPPDSGVRRAGHLADLTAFAPTSPFSGSIADQSKIICVASTLRFCQKDVDVSSLPGPEESGIPQGEHWADLTDPDTILAIEQPEGQACAVIGGIMALRMKQRGVRGCVIGGRVRDLEELKNSDLPIWARGRSTVGSSAEAVVHSRNTPVTIGGVKIESGDIMFCDPLEGVVVIPRELLDQVIQRLPDHIAAENQIKSAVASGMKVSEAFRKYRA